MNTKLKGYRTMAGFTQEELAKLLGISRLSFILKENGERRFTGSQEETIFALLKEKLPDLTMEEVFPVELE